MKSITADLSPKLTLLPLENEVEKADNRTKITVTAEVSQGDYVVRGQNVTFELSREADTFSDSQHSTTHGTTEIDGKISKTFTSWQLGSGKVTAYLSDNPQGAAGMRTYEFTSWLPDSDSKATVTLENNGATSDGVDAITAKVTLTARDGVTPLSGVSVNFELLRAEVQATFVGEGRDTSQGFSNKEGTVSKPFVDSYAEEGEVHAFINTVGEGKIMPSDKPFKFKGLQVDNIDLTLDNDGAYAGDGVIIVTAHVTDKGKDMSGQTVNFTLLDDSSAIFNDTKIKTTQGITAGDGRVSKEITDTVWETGTVHAEVFINNGKIFKDTVYTFTMPPSVSIELESLEVRESKDEEWKTDNNAPADGVAAIRATALVAFINEKGIKSPLNGEWVTFELPSFGKAVFDIDSDDDTLFKASGFTGKDGTVSKIFTCEYIESKDTPEASRTVKTSVMGPNSVPKSDSRPFTFSDPWQNVANLSVSCCSGNVGSIYKNSNHQAEYRASFVVASKFGTRLNKNNQPMIEEIIKRITLIDYDTKIPLGASSLQGVKYTLVSNEFEKEIVLSIGLVRDEDNYGNHIDDNGNVIITWYITCDENNTPNLLRVGLKIAPSGTDDIIYYALGEKQLDPPVTLQFIPAIHYGREDLSVFGEMIRHDGQSSDDDTLPKTLSDENFWRQWDYRLTIKDNEESRKMFRCYLKEGGELPNNYAFSEVTNILYNNKAYFWPNNIRNAQDQPLKEQKYYMVSSDGTPKREINASGYTNKNSLYFTLYSSFGKVNSGGHDYRHIDFRLIDQYGNSGEFSVMPENIPKNYNSSVLGGVNFIREGFSGGLPDNKPGDAEYKVLIQSISKGKFIGCCQDDYINKTLGGIALDLTSSNVYFSINRSLSNQSEQPKIFDILEWNTDASLRSITLQNNGKGLIFTNDANPGVWLIQPVWNNNHIVISNKDLGGYLSWYPADTTGGHILTYVSAYIEGDSDFKWLLA